MQWFKHDSNASQDPRLKKLKIKYGLKGYGLYWYCLELIAAQVNENKLTFELEHDAEIIAFDTGMNVEIVSEMMTYMIGLGLFENDDGIITCLKMANRLQKSMTSSPKMRKIITDMKTDSEVYAGYLYFIVADDGTSKKIKIGRSKNPWQRIKEIATSTEAKGFNLSLEFKLKCDDCVSIETETLNRFKHLRIKGEWFKFDDEIISLVSSTTTDNYVALLRQTMISPEENRIDKNRIDNIKPTSLKPKYEQCDMDFAIQAFEEIRKLSIDHKKPNLKAWATDVRKMREIDKRDLNEMAKVWMWVRQDHFWSTNVLSISKFREKYDQLKMKMNEVHNYASNQQSNTPGPDNSAAGRVRQNVAAGIAAKRAEIDQIRRDRAAMAVDDKHVRTQVDQ